MPYNSVKSAHNMHLFNDESCDELSASPGKYGKPRPLEFIIYWA
jgi:hypothetical protein